MAQYSIGFLGFGRMAQALWRGWRAERSLSFCFTSRDTDKARKTASHLGLTYLSLAEFLEQAEVVVIGVKPDQLSALCHTLESVFHQASSHPRCWVSLLAGTSIERLESSFRSIRLHKTPIVRATPNTPVQFQKGVIALSKNTYVSDAEYTRIEQYFAVLGHTLTLSDPLLDAVTGLAGSGPAFCYRIADSMARAGSRYGLEASCSLALMAQTLIGAGEMLRRSGKSVSELVSEVASPGGTTAAGLERFDQLGLDALLYQVVDAAIQKSLLLNSSSQEKKE